jgi:uncharacterized surface protein with fasciclin (FAS1) repeats
MKRFLVAAITAAAVIGLMAGPASAHDDDDDDHGPPATQPTTIAGLLLADKAGDDADGFDHNVTQAVLAFPDLTAAASDATAKLTVFAPNDRAFRRLVRDLTGTWPQSEKATFDAVVGLGLDTVKTVLTYHIIGSAISAADAIAADGASVTTLQGGTITVDVRHKRWHPVIRLIDQDPDARDPRVIEPDLGGALLNGYVHGIDRVLRPVNL